jgi:hypothetical protein
MTQLLRILMLFSSGVGLLLLPSCGLSTRNSGSSASLLSFETGLTSDNIWDYLVYSSADSNYMGYVKFSLTADGSGSFRSLILHPASFRFHAEHLTTLPEYSGLTPKQIDSISMRKSGRKLLLGTMLFRNQQNTYSLPWNVDVELISQDPLAVAEVKAALDLLAKKHDGRLAEIAYSPVAEQRLYVSAHKDEFLAAGISLAQKTMRDSVCYNSAWTVGRVQIMRATEIPTAMQNGRISTEDILVLDETPRVLPVVAGIIVGSESSPSSHPALLAKMLSIPFFYEREAQESGKWKELAKQGEYVFVKAQGDAGSGCHVIVRAGGSVSRSEASLLLSLKRPLPIEMPAYDNTIQQVLDLKNLSHSDARKVGSKAANVAALMKIIPSNTVDSGLAIPISLFGEYLRDGKTSSGEALREVSKRHLDKLKDGRLSLSQTILELEQLQKAISEGLIPDRLAKRILDPLESKFAKATRIKLRSSSNVEDNQDFNGAGLYESFGACVGDDQLSANDASLCNPQREPAPVLASVRKVWASLYSAKAFVARQYYGIDESKVGMGILVQKSFRGELANGVAISQLSQIATDESIEVNATGFPGEDDTVTNPPAGKRPETTQTSNNAVRLVVPSTEVPTGRLLMPEQQYRSLFEIINKVHKYFQSLLNPTDPARFKLDFEWKLMPDGESQKIVVKQVRPVPSEIRLDGSRGRGSIFVGERQRLWCPIASEDADALQKLNFAFPLRLDVATHEIPVGSITSVSAPIESGRVLLNWERGFLPIQISGTTASISADPWRDSFAKGNEYRMLTVRTPLVFPDGRRLFVEWQKNEQRAKQHPYVLLGSVSALVEQRISVSDGQGNSANFVAMEGVENCEQDAYQNHQQGTILNDANEPSGSTREFQERFTPTVDSNLAFDIKGRTLPPIAGGINYKTMFRQIDSVVIRGLLSRELVISEPHKSVYAPGHHNFWWQYGFDVMAAENLTSVEKTELLKRGIRYLVIPARDTGEDEHGYVVGAVDEAGKQTLLGRVKLLRPR